MVSQRQHPYSVNIAGDDDEEDVNNVNKLKSKKSVHKTIGTRSKMAAGSAISSSSVLGNVLGKKTAQMTVEFPSHSTSTKSNVVANTTAPLPQPISFFRHERAPATSCNTDHNIEKILPSSQPPISTTTAPISDPDAGRPRRAGRGAENNDSREHHHNCCITNHQFVTRCQRQGQSQLSMSNM